MHNRNRFLSLFVSAALCATSAACSSKTTTTAPIAQSAAASASKATRAKAPSVAIRPLIIKGKLQARTADSAWHDLSISDEQSEIRELRAAGKGAIIAFGSGSDTLWLRGGTQLMLAAHQDDGVLLELSEGLRFAQQDRSVEDVGPTVTRHVAHSPYVGVARGGWMER